MIANETSYHPSKHNTIWLVIKGASKYEIVQTGKLTA